MTPSFCGTAMMISLYTSAGNQAVWSYCSSHSISLVPSLGPGPKANSVWIAFSIVCVILEAIYAPDEVLGQDHLIPRLFLSRAKEEMSLGTRLPFHSLDEVTCLCTCSRAAVYKCAYHCYAPLRPYWAVDGDHERLTKDSVPIVGNLITSDCIVNSSMHSSDLKYIPILYACTCVCRLWQLVLAMYHSGALIVSSGKLLLPALSAAARLVTGVLYIPLAQVRCTSD